MEERVQYLYDLWAVLTQSVFIHVQCLSIKALCSTEGSRMSKVSLLGLSVPVSVVSQVEGGEVAHCIGYISTVRVRVTLVELKITLKE